MLLESHQFEWTDPGSGGQVLMTEVSGEVKGRPRLRPGLGFLAALGLTTSLLVGAGMPASQAQAVINVPADHPTIQQAIDAASDGDTVLVAPGVYVGGIDFTGKDISVESSAGPTATVIDGDGGTGVKMGPDGALTGFTVTGSFAAFGAGAEALGTGSLIQGNIFDGNNQSGGGFGAGIGGNSASPIIDGNLFTNNRCDSQFLSGVVALVNTSSPVITNNVFVGNPCRAINMTNPTDAAPLVVNNTIRDNRVGVRVDRRIDNSAQVFRNNIIVGNDIGLEVDFGTEANNPTWEHNLVFGNTVDYDVISDQTGTNGNVSVDPLLFMGRRLCPGSPAVDAGSAAGAPAIDFEGTARPADGDGDGTPVVDLGAYEFVPGGPPVAPDDGPYYVLSGGSITIGAPGVLGNDGDPECDALTAVKATDPAHGSVSLQADGSFVYQHDGSAGSIDSFTYTARDGGSSSGAATVTLVLLPGSAPVAIDDGPFTVDPGGTVSGLVLDNDSDPDGGPLTAVLVSDVSHGALSLQANGFFTYTHDGSATTADSFTYKANDGQFDSNLATVSITIRQVNRAPTAVDDGPYRVVEGGAVFVDSVLDNDSDPDGDPLTAELDVDPTKGAVLMFPDGAFWYVHDGSNSTSDQFFYRATDGALSSSPARVSITVDPVSPYGAWIDITDDSGAISLDVPAPWSDVLGVPWGYNDEIVGPALSAAPDREAWLTGWGTPGVFVGASAQIDKTVDELLDENAFDGECLHLGRDPYARRRLTGKVDTWALCGNEGSTLFVIAAEPEDGSFVVVVQLLVVDSADQRAVDRILGSLDVELAPPPPPPGTPPPGASPEVGLVDPGQGRWHLRAGDGQVTSFFFGNPGDVPVMGDWDCDGVDTPGLFRTSDAFAYLANANRSQVADIRFFFGDPSDMPLAGDWDGDGCDTLSIYRPDEQRFYIVNELGRNEGGLGPAEFSFTFGDPGDKPVVGDWDGDGIEEVGLHRESTGFFYWRNTLTAGIAHGEIFFGDPNDRFVAGDWGVVDGTDSPAVFRPSNTTFYFKHDLTQGIADEEFVFGEAPWLPVAGSFGLGTSTSEVAARAAGAGVLDDPEQALAGLHGADHRPAPRVAPEADGERHEPRAAQSPKHSR